MVGRDYDEIEKTVMVPLDPGAHGENVDNLLDRLQGLARGSDAHPRIVPSVSEL